MPAVFQIVSHASAKALSTADFFIVSASASPTQSGNNIVQVTQNDQDPTQMWALTPQDLGNFLIQPFGSPDLAIGLPAEGESNYPFYLVLNPVGDGIVWTISPISPYYFLLAAIGNLDTVMDVPGGSHDDFQGIQIFTRNEHTNQQWTFLPIFAQLGNDG